MSDADIHFAEAVADLRHRIVEAEMRLTAAADALTALIKTGSDTAEVEQRLNEEMDRLLVLRRRLVELQLPEVA